MTHTTEPPDDDIGPLLLDPGARAWFEEHLEVLREDAYGQRFQYWVLGIAFVVGLIAYIVGYWLRTSATGEPIGLMADLTYTLGFALWTAAVVVVLIEVVPEVKRRQIRRALEAYEATRGGKARPSGQGAAREP